MTIARSARARVRLTFAVTVLLLLPMGVSAQSVEVLHSFAGCQPDGCTADDADVGARPASDLVKGPDGAFYGTTHNSPGGGYGTIFKIAPDGAMTVLFVFELTRPLTSVVCPDGCFPIGRLALGSDGDFYGVTHTGGLYGDGTLYKIGFSGGFSKLHDFDVDGIATDNGGPWGGLVQGPDGRFYGTSEYGGPFGVGFVFRLEADGTITTVHNFSGADGQWPGAGLMVASDGNIYGTTWNGGLGCGGGYNGCGTIFRILPTGTFELMHAFVGPNSGFGIGPDGTLVEGLDGHLYGTTHQGGADSYGTAFKMAFDGTFTHLHSFAFEEGVLLRGSLVRAANGNFYGVTEQGGSADFGTVFQMTPAGAVTVLHSFLGPEGRRPYAGMAIGSDGKLHGTTREGGEYDLGVVFRLNLTPANLQISRVTAPATASVTGTFVVTDRTKNAGVGPASATSTKVWLSSDASRGDDVLLGARAVAELSVGQTHQGASTVTLPDVTPGKYYLLVEADGDEEVAESNETDNVRAKAITIGPDLIISALTFAPASPTSSSVTTITVHTKNNGAAANASVSRLYRSTNATIGAGDTLIAEFPITELAAGATQTDTINVTLPAGTFVFIAQADAGTTVAEANETNNVKKVKKLIIP
jgi:uncharacterized repeat protein (TIGR03803 family)